MSQSFLNSFAFFFFRKLALLPDDGCFFKDWWIVSPSAMVLFIYKDMLLLLTLSCIMLEYGEDTIGILQYSHRNIFKVCLAIFQHA